MNNNQNFIQNLEITIPEKTVELEYFFKIMGMCSNTKIKSPALIEATSNPELLPTTSLAIKPTNDPAISFQGKELGNDKYFIGKLPIGFNLTNENSAINLKKPKITIKADAVGDYSKIEWPYATYTQLSFKQLFERINNKVTGLDHFGIHINSKLLPSDRYEELKKQVAQSAYLIDYPHGYEWPFIMPASVEEQQNGIKAGMTRDPKFEFIYNYKFRYPEIQLDLQLNIHPKEVLALFPKPYGYYDPDPVNGDYCSTVYIYTGWNNVSLRFDLRFYIPNFSSTDWLIENGKRITG